MTKGIDVKLTIDEYAARFKMSKEMIHSRVRAKRLEYTIEGGVTYIILKEPRPAAQHTPNSSAPSPTQVRPKTTVGTIIALYQKENQQLKTRMKELETKIDRLIDDKEQMLRDERDRIEKIYTSRDEQLKTFLELVNTKLLLTSPSTDNTVHDVDVDPKENIHLEASWQNSNFIELRKYLKQLELDPSQKKQIKKRFANGYGHDVRVIQQNGEFFLDFSKYDYSDLLKH